MQIARIFAGAISGDVVFVKDVPPFRFGMELLSKADNFAAN